MKGPIPLLAPVLALSAVLPACGEASPLETPPLPGVAAGEQEWFWRDVLAAPLPGEAPPVARGPADPAARLDALADLADAGDPAALTTLMAALRDDQIGVAAGAAHLLGVHGHRAAIPRLLKGIGPYPIDYDVPIEVRAAEASALARLGNPAGISLILDLLAEGTDLQRDRADVSWASTSRMAFIQELALEGLLAMAGTDFDFQPAASVPDRAASVQRARDWWSQQRIALWSSAPVDDAGLEARAELLVAHLGAYQLRQIDGARYTLTHLGPSVLPELEAGMRRGDDYVQVHCLEIMERLCALVDDKVQARVAILAAEPLLADPDVGLASQAARTCGAARVPDPLVMALDRRTEPEVLLSVVDALAATGSPTALEALRTWWARSPAGAGLPDMRAAVEGALLALDPERSPDALLALLSSEDPSEVYAAADRLLALTGSDFDLDPARSPEERAEALAAAREALLRRAR